MKLISLKDAKPGMKVVKPVTDPGGALLLKEGVDLTPEWLDRLRARRVEFVYVEDFGEPGTGKSREEQLAEIDKTVDHMFAEVTGHDVMRMLQEYSRNYLKSKVH